MKFVRFYFSAALLLKMASSGSASDTLQQQFSEFLSETKIEALSSGISLETWTKATEGLSLDAKILPSHNAQPEFNQTIQSYLKRQIVPARIAKGMSMAHQLDAQLRKVEVQTGVSRGAILAIWAMESNFGESIGNKHVIRSLASLACCTGSESKRDEFRNEFLSALKIIQGGKFSPASLIGSWAGAMGQVQFMPSSYIKYAIDGNGDGKKDIWGSAEDSTASIAYYLQQKGWVRGVPWGFSVNLPGNFNYDLISKNNGQPCSIWQSLGLTRRDGKKFTSKANCSLFLPAGAGGPAYLLTENFWVIKTYNISDAYTLCVGLLGDRMLGATEAKEKWPANEVLPDRKQISLLQKRLKALGYKNVKVDGKIGPDLRTVLRAWQTEHGLISDGYPSQTLVDAVLAQALN